MSSRLVQLAVVLGTRCYETAIEQPKKYKSLARCPRHHGQFVPSARIGW